MNGMSAASHGTMFRDSSLEEPRSHFRLLRFPILTAICAVCALMACGRTFTAGTSPAKSSTSAPPTSPAANSNGSARPQGTQKCTFPVLNIRSPLLAGHHHSVWGASSAAVYVVGDAGELLLLDGAGGVSTQTVPVRSGLRAIAGTSLSDIYAAGDDGVVLHSIGDGTWQQLAAPVDVNYVSVWASGTDVFAVGAAPADGPHATVHGGPLVHSPDGGKTWEQSTTGAEGHPGDSFRPYFFSQVWGTSANDVFAVGSFHRGLVNTPIIYHYAGRAWTEMSIDDESPYCTAFPATVNEDAISVWGTIGGAIFIGGDGEPFGAGAILHRNPDGTFHDEKIPLADPTALTGFAPVAAIWGSDSMHVVAAAGSAILARPVNDNAPWCLAGSAAGNVVAMWGLAGSSTFYAVGDYVQQITIE
jgi:hypothetical protein